MGACSLGRKNTESARPLQPENWYITASNTLDLSKQVPNLAQIQGEKKPPS